MTTRRRRLFSLPALPLVVVLISACGGGSSTSSTTGSSTTAAFPDLAAGQSPPRSPSAGSPRRHPGQPPGNPRPLPGHPKLGSKAGPAAASLQGGESSPRPHSQTGEPRSASTPAAGATSRPARKQHAPITRASARAAERTVRRHVQAAHRQLASQAGAAAPFLVAEGDNSIPTYGTEASGSQLAAAEATLSSYLSARAAGEWAQACALMSASVAKQLEALSGEAGAGQGCAAAYAKLSEQVPAAARADPLTQGLAALRIESPHAFALFVGSGEQQYMMPLEEEGGGWKVIQIEPVPWPVGSGGR